MTLKKRKLDDASYYYGCWAGSVVCLMMVVGAIFLGKGLNDMLGSLCLVAFITLGINIFNRLKAAEKP